MGRLPTVDATTLAFVSILTIDVGTIANCAECPFAKDGKPPHKPVPAEIPDNPQAILIGEGPGADEVRENRPFVGATGQQLNAKLVEAGIPRHRCVVANATACKPPPGKTDAMLGRAAKCCHPLFLHQVGKYLGLPKLALGKWAAWAITQKAPSVEHSRGFVRDGKLIITYHPTYAFFRNPWVRGDFEIDLLRFKRLIDGRLQAAPTVVVAPTAADVHKLLQHIKANGNKVAVDIETAPEADGPAATGKDPTRASLKTIAFGTTDYALAFKWPITNGLWDLTHAILQDPAIQKVFHNGYFFDLRVLKRYGIEVVNVTDTREIRRALVATSGLSLRYLAQTYVDFPPWKELEDDK